MKKILTIVVLVLALALLASFALAATNYGNAIPDWQLKNALNDSVNCRLPGLPDFAVVGAEDLDKLAKLECGETIIIKVKGYLNSSDKQTREITVVKDHEWEELNDGIVDCTTGYTVGLKCKRCGAEDSYTVAPTSHTWKQVDNKITCKDWDEKAGKVKDDAQYSYWECTKCKAIRKNVDGTVMKGDLMDTSVLAGQPKHEYKNKDGKVKWGVTEGLTCTAGDPTFSISDGKVANVCWICGEKDAATEVDVTATGKKYLELKAEIEANYPGLVWGHTFDSKPYKKTPASCYEPAMETYWCTRCTFMIDIPVKDSKPAGHVYGIMPGGDCLHGLWLDNGGVAGEVRFGCTVCKDEKLEKVAHVDDWWTKGGNLAGAEVSVDYDGVTYTAIIAHDFEAISDKTYTMWGFEADSMEELKAALLDAHPNMDTADICRDAEVVTRVMCTKCDRVEEARENAGHVYSPWTLVNKGATTNRYESHCVNCNKLRISVAEKQPCEDGKHVWTVKDPTKVVCDKINAKVEMVCSICGEKDTLVDKYFGGHDWKTIAVIEAATCTNGGQIVAKCARCNKIEVQNSEVLDHELVLVPEVPATCAKAGTEAYYLCTSCGKFFSAEDGETELKGLVAIPKTEDHVWDEGVVTKEATVEADGVKTYTCTICGKTKTEAITKLLPATEIDKFDATFDTKDNVLTGKAVVKTGTEEPAALFARVTFFFSNGTYNVGSVQLAEDGTFEYMTGVDVVHVAVQIVNNNKVRPGDFTSYTGKEFDVK